MMRAFLQLEQKQHGDKVEYLAVSGIVVQCPTYTIHGHTEDRHILMKQIIWREKTLLGLGRHE